jgi:hypothetical protein
MNIVKELAHLAAGISSGFRLAALAIVAVIFVILKWRGKLSLSVWIASLTAIVLFVLVPILASHYVELETTKITDSNRLIYRLRVTVLSPEGTPVSDAIVTNSLGGYATRAASAWQFDVPVATKPADGKITVYAIVENAFLKGKNEVLLADDHNPTTTVQLVRDASARVRGIVVDSTGKALSGAQVLVVGFGSEAVITQRDGGFVLPAHAADGQLVELHVQKGRKSVKQWTTGGQSAVTILLN